MPHTLSLDVDIDVTRRKKVVNLQDQLTGAYTTGGDPIDFTAIANPGFRLGVPLGRVPSIDEIYVDNVPGGYSAQIVPNPAATNPPTLQNAYSLQVFSAPGVQLAAGVYPALLLASPLTLVLAASQWGF